MKNKTIITIAACMLFVLAGFSDFAGERVYIREFNIANQKAEVVIYEKGTTSLIKIEGAYSKREESLKSFADILEKYFQQGYKIISSSEASGSFFTDFILEKP